MNDNDDSARFTILDDPQTDSTAPDALYLSDAESLRIEKLSTRVTLVAVLIPCLLVVVLAVAYLDIKKRVINTQHSGSMGVQNLSKDLESRFSNLSLRQAKIEEQLAEQARNVETTVAAMQVNLKKHADDVERRIAQQPDQAAFEKLQAEMEKTSPAMSALRQEMKDLAATFDRFDEELAGQIQRIADGLKQDQDRFAEMGKTVQRLDAEKTDKAALDLALDLSRLSLKETINDRLQVVDKKLAAVEKTMKGLDQRIDALAKKIAATPPPASPAPAAKPYPRSSPPPSGSADGAPITEQTIE